MFAAAMAAALLTAAGTRCSAVESDTLTTIQAIRALAQDTARSGRSVAFEGTVTYYNPGDVDLFVQSEGQAIYVESKAGQNLAPGDRVLVRGKTRASFYTDVLGESVTVLHHGELPQPAEATFDQLIRAERDCMLVKIRATVRSADVMTLNNTRYLYLRLLMRGGYVDATVVGADPEKFKNLQDAEIEITGAASGQFDSKMQLIGVLLEVPSLAQVKILQRAGTNVDSLPLTPMAKILSAYSVIDQTERVRVQGTITYYRPGSAIVLQNGNSSLWVSTRTNEPMEVGDFAEATGYPDERSGFLALNDGEVRDTHIYKPVEPQAAIWRDLADWSSGDARGHQNDLVSIEGKVVAEVREQAQDEYDLESDSGKLFNAIYYHPPDDKPLAEMPKIPLQTRIRVTGICTLVQGGSTDPSVPEVPFNILLRTNDDIAVISNPPLVSVRNLTILVGVLAVLLLAAGAWGWVLERRVRYQNAEAAYSERQRGRILEDINGTRPLAEVLDQITELMSFKLHGATCWCQITDGAHIGKSAPPESFRVISLPIQSHTGPPLGTLYAAFNRLAKPRPEERETLSMAANVAALAIETRRLYSDLVHRSKFDLLTDIHNRFSLESLLDQQISDACQNEGSFGLVYVDLDHFKQVNDRHGHLAGDQYLREVALRMKRQLRPHDMLARLGGDEFAALLPEVRNLVELEEIAQRLRACLKEPFRGDGFVVHSSASIGIALYPEDGATRDSLLNSADAAMYVDKYSRREAAANSPHTSGRS